MSKDELKEDELRTELGRLGISPMPDDEQGRSQQHWLVPLLITAFATGAVFFGTRSRMNAEQKRTPGLRADVCTGALDGKSVNPKKSGGSEELTLPGNIQAFISSPIYVRPDGYLTKRHFDMGAWVKAGQLLATVQTPEVTEQLAQARSMSATAQTNLELAKLTRDQYQSLLNNHAVTLQGVDDAIGAYCANKAIVDAEVGNVRHYDALMSFENVYARFDGVITARNIDIGAPINSGSSTAPRTDLFDIVHPGTSRVYVILGLCPMQ